jgi:glycosidase
MVKASHQAGIGVVLDIVYNHTVAGDKALHKFLLDVDLCRNWKCLVNPITSSS